MTKKLIATQIEKRISDSFRSTGERRFQEPAEWKAITFSNPKNGLRAGRLHLSLWLHVDGAGPLSAREQWDQNYL